MKETIMIKVGDVVRISHHPEETATLYKVLSIANECVTRVQVVRDQRNYYNIGEQIDCRVQLTDWSIVGPALTPKELVCRKVLQLQKKFENRPKHKVKEEVVHDEYVAWEDARAQLDRAATQGRAEDITEIIRRYAERQREMEREQMRMAQAVTRVGEFQVQYNPQTWATQSYYDRVQAQAASTATMSGTTSAVVNNAYSW